jgi:Raf kinase inhibitor-like YbhB/YbcL family protein
MSTPAFIRNPSENNKGDSNMKKTVVALTLAAVSCTAGAAGFTLSSPDVSPQARIAEKYVLNSFGCTGGNVSPALMWTKPPVGTQSLALTVYDPDAPTGSGWWHWIVYDIPAGVSELPGGFGNSEKARLPDGTMQGRTDFGKPGWGGPCPPKGDKAHRYTFTLHALKTSKLEVPADASGALIGYMIHMNEIGRARFIAPYGR